MDNRGKTMIKNEFDFGFAVDWMRKDLGIVFSEATTNGSSLPITKMVDEFYEKVQQGQGNRLDTSSLISLLRNSD
jgi:3-hydroxyisobutyrate dehydrogenase